MTDTTPEFGLSDDLVFADIAIDGTVRIVEAYVSRNAVSRTDLGALISEVHRAVSALGGAVAPEPAPELVPAVPVKKSVTPDFIYCLEDGKKFRSLKRHIRTHYDLTPEQYREKWNLPSDYPFTAPNYSARRSELAKQNGLGRKAPGLSR